MRKVHLILTVVTLCLIALIPGLFSQIVLQGVIKDNGSEPIDRALVELIDQADANRKFSDYTDNQGQYTIEIEETGVEYSHSQNPGCFNLFQNYPNPFNPSTVIGYELPQPADFRIDIYNILGQKIKTLFNGFQANQSGRIVWDGSDDLGRGVPAGVYIYSLKAEGAAINKKMLLIDGQQGVSGGVLQQAEMDLCRQMVINKIMSNQYLLRVTGTNIETYEQPNLEITSNTTLVVTVIRTVTDIDGNVYRAVKIGSRWWIAENLKVTHYRNGEAIPNVTDKTEWSNLTAGAYCNYNNNENNAVTYGRLYNWFSVIDSRNIAPVGWHVPDDEEWKQLEMYLGMSQSQADAIGARGTDEGGKLKEAGITHWASPNTGANNESGFTALPGGYGGWDGSFGDMGSSTTFWSAAEGGSNLAWGRRLNHNRSEVTRASYEKRAGFSVRLVTESPLVPELTSTPYINAADVWVSMRYKPEHQGIDFSTLKNIPIRAPGKGTFYKHMYYHPGVPRWQVNTEIYIGKYSIDLLFEPGDFVTQEEAQLQYDMLIADGTPVMAGDSLGMLYRVPGQKYGMLHFGVHHVVTGQAECLTTFCSPEVLTAILNLFHRDYPGEQICYCHTY